MVLTAISNGGVTFDGIINDKACHKLSMGGEWEIFELLLFYLLYYSYLLCPKASSYEPTHNSHTKNILLK